MSNNLSIRVGVSFIGGALIVGQLFSNYQTLHVRISGSGTEYLHIAYCQPTMSPSNASHDQTIEL